MMALSPIQNNPHHRDHHGLDNYFYRIANWMGYVFDSSILYLPSIGNRNNINNLSRQTFLKNFE
jgi:hypothetical protein